MHLEKHLLRLLRSALLAVSAFSLCHDQAVAKEHEIIVQGSKATIDGLPLTLTIPCKTGFATIISYKSAVQALGPVERSGYGHNDLALVWDSLGFHLLRDGNHSEDGQLWNFAGSLRKNKSPRDMDMKSQYTGALWVNGILITSTTRLSDIEPALRKQGFRPSKVSSTCYCIDKGHYELDVCIDDEGFVYRFIFRSDQITALDRE